MRRFIPIGLRITLVPELRMTQGLRLFRRRHGVAVRRRRMIGEKLVARYMQLAWALTAVKPLNHIPVQLPVQLTSNFTRPQQTHLCSRMQALCYCWFLKAVVMHPTLPRLEAADHWRL
jgi:hypothetical protein